MKTTLTHQELEARGFFCTDGSESTEQWVRKISDTQFEVYERAANVMHDIDLSEYDEQSLEDHVGRYYSSLAELKEIYGDDSNQIIAECISENDIVNSVDWDEMAQKLI